MDFKAADKLINEIYRDIDGFKISEGAIRKSSTYYIGMNYDEVTNESFHKILSYLPDTNKQVFIDLGSGVGKKVFLSAFCFGFSRCTGIELLTEVYQASVKALDNYIALKNKINKEIREKNISFLNMDIVNADLSEGNVFYMSMSRAAMEIELTGDLIHKLECCQNGTIVITTGIPFESPFYKLQRHEKCSFSDGEGDVFFHERTD